MGSQRGKRGSGYWKYSVPKLSGGYMSVFLIY